MGRLFDIGSPRSRLLYAIAAIQEALKPEHDRATILTCFFFDLLAEDVRPVYRRYKRKYLHENVDLAAYEKEIFAKPKNLLDLYFQNVGKTEPVFQPQRLADKEITAAATWQPVNKTFLAKKRTP